MDRPPARPASARRTASLELLRTAAVTPAPASTRIAVPLMTSPAIVTPGTASAPLDVAALPSAPAAMPEIPGFLEDDHTSGPLLLGLLGLIGIALRGRRGRLDPKLVAAPLDGGGELLDFR